MRQKLRQLRQLRLLRHDSERGASAVEYGLLVAAIAAIIVGLVFGLGSMVQDAFSKTSSCITTSALPVGSC